jgi:hypothetical protein
MTSVVTDLCVREFQSLPDAVLSACVDVLMITIVIVKVTASEQAVCNVSNHHDSNCEVLQRKYIAKCRCFPEISGRLPIYIY